MFTTVVEDDQDAETNETASNPSEWNNADMNFNKNSVWKSCSDSKAIN